MDTTPIDAQPLRSIRSVIVDENSQQTGSTSSLPIMDPNYGAIIPYVGSNNLYDVDIVVGPNTVPAAKRGRGRPRGSKNLTPNTKKVKVNDPNRRFVEPRLNFDSGIADADRESGNMKLVDSVMMRFDAVRRRFCQLNVKGLQASAFTNCMKLGVRTNTKKRIGPIPGIEIGDIFYFWGEMCLVGLHLQTVAGIDYIPKKDDALEGSVATSVVSSGRYDDSTEGVNTLIYTGHGGKDKEGVPRDQKLEKGNLAMKLSYEKGNDVRVIIGVQDPCNPKSKIYIYDGLYVVVGLAKVKDNNDCEQFKFTLERNPNQPPGYSLWKEVERWKTYGLNTRKGFLLQDLSNGSEKLPIAVVNDIDEDDKTLPESFDYDKSSDLNDLNLYDRPIITCSDCVGRSCSRNDINCICVKRNYGELPYHDQTLVCRRPMVHECGDLCVCAPNCKNRLVQGGLKLSLEVFKTKNCGWGLRSREPIRGGTYICDFSGVSTMGEVREDNEYLFNTFKVYPRFRWNYEPELTSENVWEQVSEVFELSLHMVIDAKNSGNIGRFMNHSCNANVFWQPVEVERNKEVHLYIAFFAKKHIPPLTELTYDYGSSIRTDEIAEDGYTRVFKGKKTCLCGFVNCRGSFELVFVDFFLPLVLFSYCCCFEDLSLLLCFFFFLSLKFFNSLLLVLYFFLKF